MEISAHAVVRFLERIEGQDFSVDRAYFAALIGQPTARRVSDAQLLQMLRKERGFDTASAYARAIAAVKGGQVAALYEGGVVTTIVPLGSSPKEKIVSGKGSAYSPIASRQFARILRYNARYEEESDRTLPPLKKRRLTSGP